MKSLVLLILLFRVYDLKIQHRHDSSSPFLPEEKSCWGTLSLISLDIHVGDKVPSWLCGLSFFFLFISVLLLNLTSWVSRTQNLCLRMQNLRWTPALFLFMGWIFILTQIIWSWSLVKQSMSFFHACWILLKQMFFVVRGVTCRDVVVHTNKHMTCTPDQLVDEIEDVYIYDLDSNTLQSIIKLKLEPLCPTLGPSNRKHPCRVKERSLQY